MTTLSGLIERVEAGERSNELDVLIEVALFKPSEEWKSVRANSAGTKVIYTDKSGAETTHWVADLSADPDALASLRALQHQEAGHG